MIGTWLWVLLGLVGTGLLALLVSSNGGKKRLQKWRRRLLRRALGDSAEAVSGARP